MGGSKCSINFTSASCLDRPLATAPYTELLYKLDVWVLVIMCPICFSSSTAIVGDDHDCIDVHCCWCSVMFARP